MGTIHNITFENQARFDEFNAKLKGDNYDLVIGDSFFVIRNQSTYVDSTTWIYEDTYQFLQDQLFLIRNRTLQEADKTKFKRFFIDNKFRNQLSLLLVT
jgi:hypothetical protein